MSNIKHRPVSPPLNALRAFEAAARLQSFVEAANELSVTAAAVAQQIKTLEHWADLKLFDRKTKGVILTPAGEMVRDAFIPVFDQLGLAVQRLRSISSPGQIQIAALPSIAQFWLSPILPEVRRRFPDTSISVNASENPPNMNREPIDISIYFDERPRGPGEYRLTQDIIFPVCAPSLMKAIQNKSSQAGITLFHDNKWSDDWNTWLSKSNEIQRDDTRGPIFSLYALAVEEVKNGAGALIGHDMLVRQFLKTGELVKPFKKEVKLKRWLTIKLSASHSVNPVVGQISDFLIELSQK